MEVTFHEARPCSPEEEKEGNPIKAESRLGPGEDPGVSASVRASVCCSNTGGFVNREE